MELEAKGSLAVEKSCDTVALKTASCGSQLTPLGYTSNSAERVQKVRNLCRNCAPFITSYTPCTRLLLFATCGICNYIWRGNNSLFTCTLYSTARNGGCAKVAKNGYISENLFAHFLKNYPFPIFTDTHPTFKYNWPVTDIPIYSLTWAMPVTCMLWT